MTAEVAMRDSYLNLQYFHNMFLNSAQNFSSWLAFRSPFHPFFCHPERKRRIHIFLKSGRLRFTSAKFEQNFQHNFKNLLIYSFFFIATSAPNGR